MSYVLLNGASDASGFGLFRTDGGRIIPLIRQKVPALGIGGGSIGGVNSWSYNDQGAVTANSSMSGAAGGSNNGLFYGTDANLVSLVRDTQAAPGGRGKPRRQSCDSSAAPITS